MVKKKGKEKAVSRLTLFFLLLATGLVLVFGLIGWMEYRRSMDAEVVNRAGKQRMLSQRILYLAEKIQQDPDPENSRELDRAIGEFRENLRFLAGESPDAMRESYRKALQDKTVLRLFVSHLEDPAEMNLPGTLDGQRLLEELDSLVENYTTHTRIWRSVLLFILYFSLAASLFLIGISYFFYILPVAGRLESVNRELARYVRIVEDNVLTSTTDPEGRITFVSDAYCRVTGYSREELLDMDHSRLRHPETPAGVYQEIRENLSAGRIWRGELRNRKKNGIDFWVDAVITPVYDESGKLESYLCIREDITDRKRIENLSVTDEMTGLFNRRLFNRVVPGELHRRDPENIVFAFVILDVDFFKQYNDTYGHQNGDGVLAMVASVLKDAGRLKTDMAFRLGGEEFGCIFTESSEDRIHIRLEAMRNAIQGLGIPHERNPGVGVVTASFGATVLDYGRYPDAKTDQDEIYRLTDDALYQAKRDGRNRICYRSCEDLPESRRGKGPVI